MTVALSFEDTVQVLERIEAESELVLIGGQALNYWCGRYKVDAPELETHGPFASKDVDFQGDRSMASRCAALLGGKYAPYNRRDAPFMLGIVQYTNAAGIEHAIDFLARPEGLKPAEVVKYSIPVEVDGSKGCPIEFRVMHPVHCLKSRAANVIDLADTYDNDRGIKQLKAAVLCTRQFIRELSLHNARGACAANENVFEFAKHRLGIQVFRRHLIEVFDAVFCQKPLPEKFRTIRYPQMVEQLASVRNKPRPAPV